MPNGQPTNTFTGEPFLTTPASTGIVLPTVINGVLTAADSGQATTAAYSEIVCREEIQGVSAEVSFVDGNDGVGLISTVAPFQSAIGVCSIHNIIGNNFYNVGYFTNSSGTPVLNNVFSANYAPAVPPNKKCLTGWWLIGNDSYLLLPNGNIVGPLTSSAIATRTGKSCILEHFRNSTGTPGCRIHSYSINTFSDLVAAGRTQLLTNAGNTGAGSWSETFTGPTTGQADAGVPAGTRGEKFLETVANQNQFLYQQLTKAAAKTRYSAECKVKGFGRDWVYLYCPNLAQTAYALVFFNVTTGVIGAIVGTFTDILPSIYQLPNGFWQIAMDFVSDTDTTVFWALGTASSNGTSVFAGDVTKGLIVYDQKLVSRPL